MQHPPPRHRAARQRHDPPYLSRATLADVLRDVAVRHHVTGRYRLHDREHPLLEVVTTHREPRSARVPTTASPMRDASPTTTVASADGREEPTSLFEYVVDGGPGQRRRVLAQPRHVEIVGQQCLEHPGEPGLRRGLQRQQPAQVVDRTLELAAGDRVPSPCGRARSRSRPMTAPSPRSRRRPRARSRRPTRRAPDLTAGCRCSPCPRGCSA